jgi:hypothetical protein
LVIAKFRVIKKAEMASWGTSSTPHEITMTPVRGEPFGTATPSGGIMMLIFNADAAAQLHVGREYHVTFEEAGDTPA